MNVLIVDDEVGIREVVKEYLYNEGYNVLESNDGKEAIEKIKNNNIDIIILDIMMPHMDGYTTLKEIKKIKDIPVIILSSRNQEYDKLQGFDLGISDYVTKPFSPKELMARIKAVLGRVNQDNKYVYKNLKIDYLGHSIYINGKEIFMTPKEYDLLLYFVKNKGIALSRETLLSKVWGYNYYGDYRTIDTHIKLLRGSLGEYRYLIKTIRSVGYKYEEI